MFKNEINTQINIGGDIYNLKKILQIKKIKKAIVNYIFTFAHEAANGHKNKLVRA